MNYRYYACPSCKTDPYRPYGKVFLVAREQAGVKPGGPWPHQPCLQCGSDCHALPMRSNVEVKRDQAEEVQIRKEREKPAIDPMRIYLLTHGRAFDMTDRFGRPA